MAVILLLETATLTCSVALSKDGTIVANREVTDKTYSHAEKLNGFISDTMAEAGVQFKDLDAIAVSKGPGSYTGLRIGTSTAKGLCYALDVPLIAVGTLHAMAQGAADQKIEADYLCPMIDARRMEVYTTIFSKEMQMQQEVEAVIVEQSSFDKWLQKGVVAFFGDGAGKCAEVLGGSENARIIENFHPSAVHMNKPATRAFEEKTFEDMAYFEPYYLKEFVAGKPKKLL